MYHNSETVAMLKLQSSEIAAILVVFFATVFWVATQQPPQRVLTVSVA